MELQHSLTRSATVTHSSSSFIVGVLLVIDPGKHCLTDVA